MQSSDQISAKSADICNSYSKFSKVTQNYKCLLGTCVIDCQVCVRANCKTSAHLKSVFKMSTLCTKSNASSKTWTPLPGRFIDDHLVEMFNSHSSIRRDFSYVTWLRIHTILQLPPNLVVDWVKVRTVGWPVATELE